LIVLIVMCAAVRSGICTPVHARRYTPSQRICDRLVGAK
jgi:hypothetical protein